MSGVDDHCSERRVDDEEARGWTWKMAGVGIAAS
jgi:hypothetical protein